MIKKVPFPTMQTMFNVYREDVMVGVNYKRFPPIPYDSDELWHMVNWLCAQLKCQLPVPTPMTTETYHGTIIYPMQFVFSVSGTKGEIEWHADGVSIMNWKHGDTTAELPHTMLDEIASVAGIALSGNRVYPGFVTEPTAEVVGAIWPEHPLFMAGTQECFHPTARTLEVHKAFDRLPYRPGEGKQLVTLRLEFRATGGTLLGGGKREWFWRQIGTA